MILPDIGAKDGLCGEIGPFMQDDGPTIEAANQWWARIRRQRWSAVSASTASPYLSESRCPLVSRIPVGRSAYLLIEQPWFANPTYRLLWALAAERK